MPILLVAILLAAGLVAQEPMLTVKGTIQYYDGTPASNLTFEVVKMTADGREIIVQRGGKDLPPPATGRTDKDGKFTVEVPKSAFGGMVMRFGFEVPVAAGQTLRYGRTKEGRIAVVEVAFEKESIDLDKTIKVIYVKK